MPGLTKSSFIDIRFHGELCRLYADASLFLPDEQTLILSDLHLQKGFAQSKGAPLPGYDTQDTLNRAEQAIRRNRPVRTILLGDSFHTSEAAYSLPAAQREHIARLGELTELIWITGNHDPDLPADLPGRALPQINALSVLCSHLPAFSASEEHKLISPQIIGHYHPKAKLKLKARHLTSKCFIFDSQLLIMPAFGSFTGGLNVISHDIQRLLGPQQKAGFCFQDSIYLFPVTSAHFTSSV